MLYSYGSFLSKITLSLLCIVVPVPYVSINPSKKREVQVVSFYNFFMAIEKTKEQLKQDLFNKVKGIRMLLDNIDQLSLETEERFEMAKLVATSLRSIFIRDKENKFKNLIERTGFDQKLLFPINAHSLLNLYANYPFLSFKIIDNKTMVEISDDVDKKGVVWNCYITFSSWLNEIVIDTKCPDISLISRYLLVRIVSDKEGAHVDDTIDEDLSKMMKCDVVPVFIEGIEKDEARKELEAKSVFYETIIAIAKEFVYVFEEFQNSKISLIGPSRFCGVIQVFKYKNDKFKLHRFGTISRDFEENVYNSSRFHKCEVFKKIANNYEIKQGKMKYTSIILNEDDLLNGEYMGTYIYGE